MNKIFILLIASAFSSFCLAEDAKTQRRIDELERSVKTLNEKVEKMESTLMKGGGFMIVANVTCEINTPFNGEYAATELSEQAARNSVIEQCKAKVPDATQCLPQFVKCKK